MWPIEWSHNLLGILVSIAFCYFHERLPKLQQIKITSIYYLEVLQVRKWSKCHWVLCLVSHKTKIKVLTHLGSSPQALEVQVVDRIWPLENVGVRSLFPCWLLNGDHFLLIEAPSLLTWSSPFSKQCITHFLLSESPSCPPLLQSGEDSLLLKSWLGPPV